MSIKAGSGLHHCISSCAWVDRHTLSSRHAAHLKTGAVLTHQLTLTCTMRRTFQVARPMTWPKGGMAGVTNKHASI